MTEAMDTSTDSKSCAPRKMILPNKIEEEWNKYAQQVQTEVVDLTSRIEKELPLLNNPHVMQDLYFNPRYLTVVAHIKDLQSERDQLTSTLLKTRLGILQKCFPDAFTKPSQSTIQ